MLLAATPVAWYGDLKCRNGQAPSSSLLTSAAVADTIGLAYKGYADYDDCYQEDRDNYIDIILVGDEAAARNITFVEIPGLEGGYRAFYNPGGPGPEPTAGVRYTTPGPPDLEPVIIALDNPMRINRR